MPASRQRLSPVLARLQVRLIGQIFFHPCGGIDKHICQRAKDAIRAARRTGCMGILQARRLYSDSVCSYARKPRHNDYLTIWAVEDGHTIIEIKLYRCWRDEQHGYACAKRG